MNSQQVVYISLVVLLWLVRADLRVMCWITANLILTLISVGMMDMGWVSRHDATVSMMIIDLLTGVGLATRKGLGRLVSLCYAITVPIYSLNLIFGVQPRVIYTMVFVVSLVQLGAVCIGRFGGRRDRRWISDRRAAVRPSLAASFRDCATDRAYKR